jgi:hypothetical protein
MFDSPDISLENDLRQRISEWHAFLVFPVGLVAGFAMGVAALASEGRGMTLGLYAEVAAIILPIASGITVLSWASVYFRAPARLRLARDEVRYDGYRWNSWRPVHLDFALSLTCIERVGYPRYGGAQVTGLARVDEGFGRERSAVRDRVFLSEAVLSRLGLRTNRRYSDGRELGALY